MSQIYKSTGGSSPSSGFSAINVVVFDTAGTFTYTPSIGMTYCTLEAIGGGGGSGGVDITNGSQVCCSGGGGGGNYCKGTFTAAQIGASKSVTVGALGAAGSATPGQGGSGGDSFVGTTFNNSLVYAAGGGGSVAGISGSFSLGFSGAPSAANLKGDISIRGGPGTSSYGSTTTVVYIGGGGSSFYSGGSQDYLISTLFNAGTIGQFYGGGGGGVANYTSQSARVGQIGAIGIVIITEYIV